jgi:acyl carrier protein
MFAVGTGTALTLNSEGHEKRICSGDYSLLPLREDFIMPATKKEGHLKDIREVIAEVLELEPEEITETSLFAEDHEADSLRAIEILARLEKKYNVEIPQSELPKMVNLTMVYDVLAERTGWQGSEQ